MICPLRRLRTCALFGAGMENRGILPTIGACAIRRAGRSGRRRGEAERRAARQPLLSPHRFSRCGRLAALRLRRFHCCIGPRFPGSPAGPVPVSQLLAGGRSASGRSPDAARVRGRRSLRARAPHLPPSDWRHRSTPLAEESDRNIVIIGILSRARAAEVFASGCFSHDSNQSFIRRVARLPQLLVTHKLVSVIARRTASGGESGQKTQA